MKLTDDGQNDPLLADFPDEFDALCGHKEACDEVPEAARLLLTGEHCPVQMFRVGTNVYATQFHPEADAEGLSLRIHTYKNHGYFSPEKVDELVAAVKSVDTPYAQKLLQSFVQRYRRERKQSCGTSLDS